MHQLQAMAADSRTGLNGLGWLEWVDGWTDGWMVGWTDGWLVDWLDGRMDGWLVNCRRLRCPLAAVTGNLAILAHADWRACTPTVCPIPSGPTEFTPMPPLALLVQPKGYRPADRTHVPTERMTLSYRPRF